jgi:IS30 family transposase
MDRKYKQLTPEHRNQIQRVQNQGLSIRGNGRQLGMSPSTVSRESRRGLVGEIYDAVRAGAGRKRSADVVKWSESGWKATSGT